MILYILLKRKDNWSYYKTTKVTISTQKEFNDYMSKNYPEALVNTWAYNPEQNCFFTIIDRSAVNIHLSLVAEFPARKGNEESAA